MGGGDTIVLCSCPMLFPLAKVGTELGGFASALGRGWEVSGGWE